MQLQRIHMLQKSLAIESFESMVDSVDTVGLEELKQRSVCYEKKAFQGIDSNQRVVSDKTHCKPFDFQISEQWVFG